MLRREVSEVSRIGLVPICIAVASIAAATGPAMGTDTVYKLSATACEDGFTCDPEVSPPCWCAIDWDDEGAWQICDDQGENCTDPSPTLYPDAATDNVEITQDTELSRCMDGTDKGELCTSSATCDNTCEAVNRIVIQITTETIGTLNVETASGAGTAINLVLQSKDGGGNTLTAESVTVDGVNGPAVLRVGEAGTTLTTD